MEPIKKLRNLTRKALRKRLFVIVGSPHKVGSTWLFGMLRDLGGFEAKPGTFPEEFQVTGTILLERRELFDYLQKYHGFYIFKSHSPPISYALPPKLAEETKFITMVRDPRDVLVSASFYLAYLEEEKGGWGKEFSRLSEGERILRLIKKGHFLLSRLEEWFRAQIALKIRYERLCSNTVEELETIMSYLGLSCKISHLKKVVSKHSFEAKSGRNPGEERKDAFLRKGIVGDWINYFDNVCIEAFKTEQGGRWNELLIEMGYESDSGW